MSGVTILIAAAAASPTSVHVMHEFTRCVVARRPEEARRVLRLDHRDFGTWQARNDLTQRNRTCLPRGGGRLSFAGVLLAGGLAEALVERGRTSAEIGQALTRRPDEPAIVARGPSEVLSLCTALRASAETAALMASPPASEAEDFAVARLMPTVEACVEQGQQARLNKPGLRALMAIAAWRIVDARAQREGTPDA